MADPPHYPDTGDDTGVGPHWGSTISRRRWASVLGITIAIVVVLLFVVLHLTGTVGSGGH